MTKTQITIDRAGRVVIPKSLLDVMGVAPGDTLALEATGQSITLRPVRPATPLTKEKGVWVLRAGLPLDSSVAEHVLDRIRASRNHQNIARKQ
jgi:AbrB family looped-hinge helix DNA binding protein